MTDILTSHQIAEALSQALGDRDIDAVMRLYADDAVVWHNNDRYEQSKAENRASFGGFMELFDKLAYINIQYTSTEVGFVQQHVVSGLTKDGRDFSMPAVLIVTVRDGLIARIDEYLDPAPFYALFGR